MMAWYADSIKQYPDGLITQAQASVILNVSRVAVSRLVARGELRAVYYPKAPDISGIAIGQDDPTWLKLTGWFSRVLGDPHTYAFPQACYVSFIDVYYLWQTGQAKEKCKRDWNEIFIVVFGTGSKKSMEKRHEKMLEIHEHKQKITQMERELEALKRKERDAE